VQVLKEKIQYCINGCHMQVRQCAVRSRCSCSQPASVLETAVAPRVTAKPGCAGMTCNRQAL
jgi:hypothetical protein